MRDEPTSDAPSRMRSPYIHGIFALVGRSLFPLVTILLLLGTIVWGPWVTLVGAIVAWNVVAHLG